MLRIKTGIIGGFPFEYPDYEILQAAPKEVIEATVRALGIANGDNVLLGNLYSKNEATTPDTYITTEGYAWVNGILCYVPAQSVQGSGVKWRVIEEVIGGAKVFQDGGSYNTYVRDKLILEADNPGDGIAINSILNLSSYGWQLANLKTSAYSANVYPIYYRCINGYVELFGSVICDVATEHAFTLNHSFNWAYAGTCYEGDNLEETPKAFRIDAQGEIHIKNPTAGKKYFFTGVRVNTNLPVLFA
jgi:hypothetical protein